MNEQTIFIVQADVNNSDDWEELFYTESPEKAKKEVQRLKKEMPNTGFRAIKRIDEIIYE